MSKLEDFVHTLLCTPIVDNLYHPSPADPAVVWGVPLLLTGLSGTGKTSRLKGIGKALGLPTFIVHLSNKPPDQLGELYYATPDGLASEPVLSAARQCIDLGRGFIIFDEMSCVGAATQAAALSYFDERKAGDRPLPTKVRLMGAMNPPEYAANGRPITPPVANRCAWRQVDPPTKEERRNWTRGILPQLPSLEDSERKVIDNWGRHWPITTAMKDRFIEVMEDGVIHKQPKPHTTESSGPWPSDRTWHWAHCAITAARCLGKPELELEIIESLVGEAGALKWAEFVATLDLVSPLEMLTQGWTPDRKRLDRTHVSLVAMTQYLRSLPRAEAVPLLPNAWAILDKCIETGLADLTKTAAEDLVQSKLGRHGTSADAAEAAEKVIASLTDKGILTV